MKIIKIAWECFNVIDNCILGCSTRLVLFYLKKIRLFNLQIILIDGLIYGTRYTP